MRTSTLAVVALVLGILSLLVWPLGPVALILGIVAVVRTNKRPAELKGSGLAIGGIVTGGIATLLLPLALAVILPSLVSARSMAYDVMSEQNLRQIHRACLQYAQDNSGQYPPDLGTLVKSHDIDLRTVVRPDNPRWQEGAAAPDPAAWANANTDYVYLGRTLTDSAPSGTVLAYEKPVTPPRPRLVILFSDGHTRKLPTPAALDALRAAGVSP